MSILRARARFFALLCLFQIPIGLALTDYWVIDATTHFVPQQILLFIASLTIWKLPAKRKIAIPLVIAVFGLVFFAPSMPDLVAAFSRAALAPSAKAPDLQLISFNVLTSNLRKSDARDWILSTLSKQSPNLVILIETDESWVESMSDLERVLPHKYVKPLSDNFGMSVYSSLPIEGAEFESLEETCGIPTFTGTLRVGEKSLKIFGLHTLPPAPGNIPYRNACIEAVEKLALEAQGPAIVAGDLNCSPWAKCFPRKLQDPFSLLFRRHTWSILGGVVSTALDHVLHTKGVAIPAPEVGPDLGSDHRPIITQIKLD